MKKAYYYLFYKLYKWYEREPFVWYSDWKAAISIIALEIWCYVSICSYLSIILGKKINLAIAEPTGFIPYLLIVASNIYFFTPSKWEPYFNEFQEWPKSKNLTGGIIVWSTIILVILNFIFSVNLMKNLIG